MSDDEIGGYFGRRIYDSWQPDDFRSFYNHLWYQTLQTTSHPYFMNTVHCIAYDLLSIARARNLLTLAVEGVISTLSQRLEPSRAVMFTCIQHCKRAVLDLTADAQYQFTIPQRKAIDREFAFRQNRIIEVMRQEGRGSAVDRNQAWGYYLKNDQVRYALDASERLAFIGVYMAYEEFLLSCLRIAHGFPRPRGRDYVKEVSRNIREHHGEPMESRLWQGPDISLFRLARNVLVHNAGKVNGKFIRANAHIPVKRRFMIEEDVLIIRPSDTFRLFQFVEKSSLLAMKAFCSQMPDVISPPPSQTSDPQSPSGQG